MLYENIPNASRQKFIVPPSPYGKEIHVDDGVIGSASTLLASRSFGSTLVVSNRTPIAFDLASSFEIHVVSSDKGKSDKRPRGKKKGKDKKKQNSP